MASALLKTMRLLSGASRLAGQQLAAGSKLPAAARFVHTGPRAQMGKKDLVNEVKSRAQLTTDQAEAAVNAVLDSIVETVAKGEKVSVTGFGSFSPRSRSARKGRNPKTGEEIEIAATTTPGFTAGKVFKDAVRKAK